MNSEFRTPHSALIKVLLIDDSPVALKVLERILSSAPDIKVAGIAMNGEEGLDLIPRIDPDVICTDLHMPVMDGLEFVKEAMSKYTKPILVVSVSVQEGSQNIFKLLEAGAVDVFAKPRNGVESEYDKRALELISKIRILSGVKVFRRSKEQVSREAYIVPRLDKAPIYEIRDTTHDIKIVAFGASTGGPQTLEAILSKLPANFPVPIICVQHIGDEFLDGFIEWLASLCRMKVRSAKEGELPEPGTIYFPRAGTHLKVRDGGRFFFSAEPPYDGHRPSITLTFKSLAESYKNRVLSILLTGMGRDGAEGMKEVSMAGGITIAQDRESSIVFGMPKAAIELGAAKYVLRPEEIAETLILLGSK